MEPPTFTIHFFDWYARQPWPINGSGWTHKIDWAKYGLSTSDVDRTAKYYDNQFDFLNRLGVDGISYETNILGGKMIHPSDIETASIKRHNIKVGAFYDWALENAPGRPEPGDKIYVKPDVAIANTVVNKITEFYSYLPKEQWLIDKHGQMPIMIFAFGFDSSTSNTPQAWQQFYQTLISNLEKNLGHPVVLYITAINIWSLEYGFQHFPQNIRPFNFVMDSMQHQIGHNEVSWNVNFDNLGVQHLFNLMRVIRDDPRYIQEMYWLAKYSEPELVFIYDWNEYYEGANIMPDETYGDTRFNLVKAMIKDIKENSQRILPRTLLITDDFSGNSAKKDWHDSAEEMAVMFPFRRYIPQADFKLASEVKPEDLAGYDMIVSMQRSNPALDTELSKLAGSKKIIFYHPLVNSNNDMTSYFADSTNYNSRGRKVDIVDVQSVKLETVEARDDVMDIKPNSSTEVLLYANDGKDKTPVLLKRGNNYWINYFWPDDKILERVFSGIYGRSLEQAILFGNGDHAQRLFVYPGGKVVQDTFSAPAVYQHLPLPVPFTAPPPAEVPKVSK